MSNNPFKEFIDFLSKNHGEDNWITAYKHIPIGSGDQDGGMYCALTSAKRTRRAMQEYGWDVMVGSGGPGFSTSYKKGTEVTTYSTTSDKNLLRLVLVRDFYGRKEDYIEILEEFRLIHNLYYDKKTSTYLAFDEAGDEVEVVKVTFDEVKIRRSYLRAFMAARQMNLLLFFEMTNHFKHLENFETNKRGEFLTYTIYSGDSYVDGHVSFTRILGKKLITCDPVEKCGISPYEKQKKFQDFIIGGDSDEPTMFTCDPDRLANYFGANPEAPHYLTAIFFRKEVMQKYYGSSDYEILDGRLSRRGAWSLRFDNNSSNYVSVFLGDLGRDLPEKEQTYWKSFNLIPDGRSISKTNFERSFLGRFSEPENPEHLFKYKFKELQEFWINKYGWNLFLPLSNRDLHFFTSIRSMLSNEQSEFDSLILSLAKATIDSLNVQELRKHLDDSDSDKKSIALMEILLTELNSNDVTAGVSLLRGIQSVRSSGVAHRKGTEYEKIMAKLSIDAEDYRAEFDQILLEMTKLLSELIELGSNS